MAQQIITFHNLQVTGDDLNYTPPPKSQTVVMSGSRMVKNVQSIGFAAHEALIVGDLATPGMAYFENQDDTNTVQIGRDSGGTFVDLLSIPPNGKCGPVKLSTLAVYAKAAVAACNLMYEITEA